MRILFIGDVHIKQDNGEEIDILLMEIEKIVRIHKYDYIVLGGDVMHYHERLFTQSLNKSLDFIKKLSVLVHVYILVGNHDYINNSQFLTENHWMNAMKEWKNITIVDKVKSLGNKVLLCPYVPPGRFIEALSTFTNISQLSTISLIFAHQEFKGCKMGSIESVDGDEWKDEYPYVISGHIHDNQRVANNIYYPGTPLQHSFGDSNTRVVCDIYIPDEDENKDINIKDIHLNVPKKYILKTDGKDISQLLEKMNKKEKEEEKGMERKDKIKIKLDMTSDEFKLFKETKDYKDLLQKGIKVQLQKVKKNNEKEEKNNENKKNETIHFEKVLEKMVHEDEILVQRLYQEIILNK